MPSLAVRGASSSSPVIRLGPDGFRVRKYVAVLGLGFLWSCGGSPTDPSPPQPPPSISCPADVDVVSEDGQGVPVSFALPPIQGGAPPLTLACSPSSGFRFPLGETAVTCTVNDARGRSASCQFRVRVTTERRLTRTTFLAFGDSITEGKISTATLLLTLVGPGFSYPAQLRMLLRNEYGTDDIDVINEGLGGETTNGGRRRLPGTLADHPTAEVLLLLEGVNAIKLIPVSTQVSNLRFMVRTGRDAGLDVLIATLTPLSAARAAQRPEDAQRILELNAAIRVLAEDEGIGPAVDLYEAFEGRPSLLSPDGLHPSEAGYLVIAETFAEEIQRRFETGGPATTALSPSALVRRRAR